MVTYICCKHFSEKSINLRFCSPITLPLDYMKTIWDMDSVVGKSVFLSSTSFLSKSFHWSTVPEFSVDLKTVTYKYQLFLCQSLLCHMYLLLIMNLYYTERYKECILNRQVYNLRLQFFIVRIQKKLSFEAYITLVIYCCDTNYFKM